MIWKNAMQSAAIIFESKIAFLAYAIASLGVRVQTLEIDNKVMCIKEPKVCLIK